MKKISILFALIILANYSFGQKKLIKDIDFDGKEDTVLIDSIKSTIVCKLSTLNYKSISSKPIEILNETCGIKESKNGFIFYNDWMRAGYKNQFRYNSKTKKIQLIGMSRYEFGNAANDGSGESSVNLLTDDYIGNWNYFDMEKDRLIKIPTIKTKMKFGNINLENFSEETYFNYAEKCAELFNKYKKIKMAKK
ncbi:hypothetical protein [Flavobacterium foetidum]|uniref:hypothetical protein n=1 Tax=Flavobacterium foetidum TaxID=2026681 RepID=UPI001074CEB6|nr:hypothetical protein [Flavobacterium foetidum]KAF2509108.1 hypothetical protein E0W73_19050 [Flavobacterium foetidum]